MDNLPLDFSANEFQPLAARMRPIRLAEIIARYACVDVERVSALTSGIKDIHEAIERARQNRNAGRRTILFVDEVHRFNKTVNRHTNQMVIKKFVQFFVLLRCSMGVKHG